MDLLQSSIEQNIFSLNIFFFQREIHHSGFTLIYCCKAISLCRKTMHEGSTWSCTSHIIHQLVFTHELCRQLYACMPTLCVFLCVREVAQPTKFLPCVILWSWPTCDTTFYFSIMHVCTCFYIIYNLTLWMNTPTGPNFSFLTQTH